MSEHTARAALAAADARALAELDRVRSELGLPPRKPCAKCGWQCVSNLHQDVLPNYCGACTLDDQAFRLRRQAEHFQRQADGIRERRRAEQRPVADGPDLSNPVWETVGESDGST